MDSLDHILIVDDDPEIRRLLVDYLAKNGFDPVAARDGREMAQALERHAIDLVVLDLMLPDEDGLTLCRDLRARSNLPVLMLTARGDEVDRIVGLEMGADDYLAKPFNPRELLARIKTILRRTRALPPNLRTRIAAGLSLRRLDAGYGDARADGAGRPGGAPVRRRRIPLLRILLDHPHRVLNRDQLLELIQRPRSRSSSTAASTCWSAACASACATTRASRN
jgi:two-component system OmpR family response regulator